MNRLIITYNLYKTKRADEHIRGWLFYSIVDDFLDVYKISNENEKKECRLVITSDISKTKTSLDDLFLGDTVFLCTKIEVPEAKKMLLDIFIELDRIYKKDDSFAFLYRDLLHALAKLRSKEVKNKIKILSEEKNPKNSYYKMICEASKEYLLYYKKVNGTVSSNGE